MPKRVTLLSFERKDGDDKRPDPYIRDFLSKIDSGTVLMIGMSHELEIKDKKSVDLTVVDDDYKKIQEGRRDQPGINFRYTSFADFSRGTEKESFDFIVDNCASNSIRRESLRSFYQSVARLLKTNSILYSKVISTKSAYCKKHCPKRKWTNQGGIYVNFFDKTPLLRRLRLSGFNIESYKDAGEFHIIRSRFGMQKL